MRLLTRDKPSLSDADGPARPDLFDVIPVRDPRAQPSTDLRRRYPRLRARPALSRFLHLIAGRRQ